MRLSIQNQPIIADTWFPVQQLDNLQVSWDSAPGALHTLLMYDPDNPYPQSPSGSPFVHVLVVNIPDNDISRGNVVLPYTPPAPPADSDPHRYIFQLYRQQRAIQTHALRAPAPITSRYRYPLESFLAQNNLRDLVAQQIIVVDPAQRSFYLVGQSQVSQNPDHPLIIADSPLEEREQAFCSCVAQVATRQPGACNLEKAWFEFRDGRECYNPFAVCSSSVGTTSRNCMENYNYDAMDDATLESLAYLHNVTVSPSFDRQSLINNLRNKNVAS